MARCKTYLFFGTICYNGHMSNISIELIISAIRESLSPDLLSNKWNTIVERSGENNPVAGHCAIATEALYDLLGGAAAGYTPYVCSYYDIGDKRVFGVADDKKQQKTHWWLRAPFDDKRGQGIVLDATVRQYKKPFPYKNGKPTGFMSPTPPSKRARTLIERVEKKLGADNISKFRADQIYAFKKAGANINLSPASIRRYKELKLI